MVIYSYVALFVFNDLFNDLELSPDSFAFAANESGRYNW